MNLDHVFKKTLVRPFAGIRKKPEVPEGLLCKCSMCKKAIVAEDVRKNFYVCPSCNGYFRVRAQERIARIADEGSFLEWDQDLVGKNPMEFEGYEEKIAAARLKTRLKEAVSVPASTSVTPAPWSMSASSGFRPSGSLSQE